MEDEGGVRDWSLAKIAIEEEFDTGSIDMRWVGTTMVNEEGAEVPFRDAREGGAEVPFRNRGRREGG